MVPYRAACTRLKILECVDDLADNCPLSCLPLVSLLKAFLPIVDGCFGDTLNSRYNELIHDFRDEFLKTQSYLKLNNSEVRLNCSWKIYILIIHVPQFLEHFQCGMSRFTEQCGEAVHRAMKPILFRCVLASL